MSENRGPAPDFPFVEKVRVYNESDRDDLLEYLQRNPDAVAPISWLVEQWGAERTFVEWFGEGWEESARDGSSGLAVFTARFVPDRELPLRERAVVGFELRKRFPRSRRHMNVIP